MKLTLRSCRHWALLPGIAGCLAVTHGALPAAAPGGLCGQTVTTSVTLQRDLHCAGDGLRVESAAVVVNLTGHTVTGSGGGAGITVTSTDGSALIRNGTVQGFESDVVVGHAAAVTLSTVTLRRATNALSVAGSTLAQSNGNTVTGNRFTGNEVGLRIAGSQGANLVADNVFVGNRGAGAVIGDAYGSLSGTEVSRNRFEDNGASGLWLTSWFPGAAGNVTAGGNQFSRNGFAPGDQVDADGHPLDAGTAILARVGAPGTVTGNTAVRNAGTGIAAVDVVDRGGNAARKNGGEQCVGVLC